MIAILLSPLRSNPAGKHQTETRMDPSGDDIGTNPSTEPSIAELIERRLGRRAAMRGLAGVGAVAAFSQPVLAQAGGPSTLTFKELAHTLDADQHVADGYDMKVLIRWGDPVVPGAPAFDPADLTGAAQEKQFGYNNDSNLMFAGLGAGRDANLKTSKAQVEVEMAAVGGAVIEIARENGSWTVVPNSKYARRISATTPMDISGPAAGHDLMKTSADPAGRKVLGTINNCAGGRTPWGTWLTCEENFDVYFGGDSSKLPLPEMQKRYGVGRATGYGWFRHVDRFDLSKEPNEPNRFGWVVEIDPYDPGAAPVKRTALGRFKHEGCTYAIAKDGRVAFYSGDDERFDYVYKFVTAKPWNPRTRICWMAARCTSPASRSTAGCSGCRWCRARGR
jgi:uncharacterized protein